MIDQRIIDPNLFPEREQLAPFQRCLLDSIVAIQSQWAPYGLRLCKEGVTVDLAYRYVQESITEPICRAHKPPFSHAAGAIFEALFRAHRRHMIGKGLFESDQDLTRGQWFAIKSWFYQNKNANPKIPEEAIDRGVEAGVEILSNVGLYDTEKIERIEESVFGDFCQIDTDEKPGVGHPCIVLGHGTKDEKPIVHVWSSNVWYDPTWAPTAQQSPGHGVDYFFHNHKYASGFERKFYIRRLLAKT